MGILQDGELVLYGFVGDNYWDEGFTASEVLDALAEVGRETDITVRINSGGGYVNDGIAIFNALSAHKGTVNVEVDAVAASSASVIAMAGDTITMRTGALMMVHDPSGGSYGTTDDLNKTSEVLDKLGHLMASIYADQTGDAPDDLRLEMKAELWMTGEEAVTRGFATNSDGAAASACTAFDYGIYARAPENLVAMAKEEKWSFELAQKPAGASANTPTKKKEPPKMAKTKPAETPPVAPPEANASGAIEVKARIKAIMQSDAAKGFEALAEHLAFETDMALEDAEAALQAAANGAPKASDAPDPAAYRAARSAATDLAQASGGEQPATKTATLDTGAIYASRRIQKEG